MKEKVRIEVDCCIAVLDKAVGGGARAAPRRAVRTAVGGAGFRFGLRTATGTGTGTGPVVSLL